MKKSLILLSAFAMMLISSCQPEELGTVVNPNDPPEMSVKKASFSVDNAAGTVSIPVDANYKSFSVVIDEAAKSWLSFKETKAETKAELTTHKIVLAYTANPIATARQGKATIKLAALSQDVTISQAAAIPTIKISENERRINPRGETIKVTVTTNDEYNVTTPSWASFTKESGELKVEINGTGAKREGEVVFATKADPNVKATLAISQKAANVDPELINILTIGEARVDSTNVYLYKVLQSLGYTKIRLANVPFDGKTLADVAAATAGTDSLECSVLVDGKNFMKTKITAADGLAPDDWDAIVIQPSFEFAGDYDGGSIDNLVKAIRTYCEFTPLYWHMTWAYKKGASAAGFKNYGSDQMAMYNSIATVGSQVAQNKEFAGVIPVGTLIQNIRTSYVEENVLVDDIELSVNIGRLAAAYMWAQSITGKNPIAAATPFLPEKLRYDPDCIPAMQEAYTNALKTPFAVTEATQYPPYTLNFPEATAKTLIEGAGFKYEDYVQVPFVVLHYGFYNSSNGNYLTCSVFKGSNDGNMNKFAATHILPKAEIPNGSLIVVASGYQYRPEGWVTLTTKNDGKDGRPARPGNVSTSVVEVNDTWWGTFTYRAFNISLTNGNNPTAAEMKEIGTKFGIFLPKTAFGGGLQDYDNGTWNW